VHFYETFLAAYDRKMREARGVYYTPEPVVSYIVRSVDHILKTEFGLPDGLADNSMIEVPVPGKPKETRMVHKVQILDPACGTGTFLAQVIETIRDTVVTKHGAGMWPGYVHDHLLPRLYGFELLMAPYAIAHLKLGLRLKETGYDIEQSERLRVYLTNSLEEAHDREHGQLTFFGTWLAEEADRASEVKRELPIMVILGNPPYSGHSANKGGWIAALLRGEDTTDGRRCHNYFTVDGRPLGDRNPKWLNNDYVKFIRFAQWRIERTGHGVLAMITDHGYLDNPTFRGMRQALMDTFRDVHILDLHGSSKKGERAPDGSPDENVFDIQQGVSIGVFSRRADRSEQKCRVWHGALWGLRSTKYGVLADSSVESTEWTELSPCGPRYEFVGRDDTLQTEYLEGVPLDDVFQVHNVGIVTARDSLAIQWDEPSIWRTVNELLALDSESARVKFRLGPDSGDWKVALAQADLLASGPDRTRIMRILYRPFDERFTYYTGKASGFMCRPRPSVMNHMRSGRNLALVATGQTRDSWGVVATRALIGHKAVGAYDINTLFPLYVTPNDGELSAESDGLASLGFGHSNLRPEFERQVSSKLGLKYLPLGAADLVTACGPKDVFDYLYSVFHSPEYRERYASFLKTDFPRIPLTSDRELFRELCRLGARLVTLHLMEADDLAPITTYPVPGDNRVEKVRYTEPGQGAKQGRVWINATQYFEGVPPAVWEFHVGGYQVCAKWLKDRKGRQLSYADLTHYQYVVAALAETIAMMREIDEVIEAHGGWPIA